MKEHKKGSDIKSTLLVTIVLIILLCGFAGGIVLLISLEEVGFPEVFFFGVYFVVCILTIVGVLWCLHQRIKEIKGGEEDEASNY